jgi:hypothetical protein
MPMWKNCKIFITMRLLYLILVVLILWMLTGCGRTPMAFDAYEVIVVEIEAADNGCYYYTEGTYKSSILFEKGLFHDNCGKFNIGDTLQITKKP